MNEALNGSAFSHIDLPVLGKRVLRMGIAANYGMKTADAFHAAERGANLWLWTPRYRQATPVIRALAARDREQHTVAMLVTAYTAGMVRRAAENALRELRVDHLDIFMLGWLGTGAAFTQGVQDELLRLKQEGKVTAIGTSIHDRRRAGRLATDSILDAFMIRYNAKHPGAEQDIFPHLAAREPLVLAYTATSWRQLLKPVAGIEMPPFPGQTPAPPLTAGLCYRFCLSSPHVHTVWTGPKNRAQLEANLDALEQGPLSGEEDAWVRAYGAKVKARKKLPFI